MNGKYERLKTLLAEVMDLQGAMALLSWDRETGMPEGGATDRANQLSTLARIHHERFTSPEIGELLGDLAKDVSGLDPDSDEARLIKVTREDYDRSSKVPSALVEALSRASSEALPAWLKARAAKDYALFSPALARNVDLNRDLAHALNTNNNSTLYDPLHDQFEPGITSEHLNTIFSELEAAIVPLVQKISESSHQPDTSMLRRHYPEAEQISFGLSLVENFGYDKNRGRIDKSAHPFCTSFGIGDVRITTRVYEDFLNMALFATMHESGHAMYEQGVGENLARTPLANGASGGVHESQSRLWENLVGRSRAFQDYLFPRLQQAFPQQLGNSDKDSFYRAINTVQPSLNRVMADEVTYNLHILLRYEMENEMLGGRADINSLNEQWVEKTRSYFGVAPEHDTEGVLQDIHWSSAGAFAVFPSYTLGNIIGAQLFRQAHKDIADLDNKISRGEFADLLHWLQESLYRHGRKFTPNELMLRITGAPIGTEAWISYVTEKYSEIYAL